MRFHTLMLAALATAGSICAAPAMAGIIADTSRAQLNANNTVAWSAFGADGSTLSTPVFEPVGSESVHVASSSGQLLINQQGTTWNGNFANGDSVLFQPNDSDSFIVGFSTPVSAVGTQIESDTFGAFTGYMDFWSTTNVLLGEVSVSGNSSSAGDNSAVFIGGQSSAADISYVTFLVNVGNPSFPKQGDLGINQLDFTTNGTSVPEPLSLALFGAGLGGLGLLRHRRTA
ncbi:MAG TPA: PEP-CTERM sorting domain-containing protein [Aliidongia sp.]|uniref:PEP-CTERM sorting domain-containing protein n=1 Tax=Aliidongia sp. TaxID=1914230 RepID=UPI002DDD013A|nr:PEP-CTERM sorting domain-containing protein [Aliidongia sp.]HEV2677184.1 PEP-CTERM sorting domain-containing protein [Aliidongia sp.]